LTSTVQYGIAHINRQRDLQRIARLSKQAKSFAYGPKGVPFEKGVKRKVRVPVSEAAADPSDDTGARNTGRMIDLMVDGTDVYVIGGRDTALLDESMAPSPRFIDTWAISLVRSVCPRLPFAGRRVVSTVQDGHTNVPEEDLTDGHYSEGNVDSSDTGKVRKSTMKKKAAGGRKK